MTIRLGILGGGGISETHARAAAEVPGVEVAAVCGENQARTAQLAQRFGARAYRELAAFLEHPGLDAVLIGSPSDRHAEQALAAVGRRLHVLVEKPVDIPTEGTVVLEHDRITVCELRTPPNEPAPGSGGTDNPSATSASVSDVSGHRRIIEDLLRAIETDGSTLCDAREGRRSVELVEAIYRSARTGSAVQLRPAR